jgi:hypothetical protein
MAHVNGTAQGQPAWAWKTAGTDNFALNFVGNQIPLQTIADAGCLVTPFCFKPLKMK